MAKRIVIHWIEKGRNMTACGRLITPDLYHTSDDARVTCKRCRKSAAFRTAGMKGVKRG